MDSKSRSTGMDIEFRRRLGMNLRRARLNTGMTLEEVADRFSLNTNMVWRWEAGRSAPMIDRLVELAQLYHVTPDALLTGPEPPLPEDFTAAISRIASGLSPDDLDIIIDFVQLLRQRRQQQRSPARVLPVAAEEPASYETRSEREE